VEIERILGRTLLQLACRHIFEVILKAAFQAAFGATTGPDVSIFQNFRRQWSTIHTKRYQPGITDRGVLNAVSNYEEGALCFAVLQVRVSLKPLFICSSVYQYYD